MSQNKGLVYVVDDDPQALNSMVELCNSAGFTAHGFESGEVFLRSTPIERPSCVVLDLKLGGMSGSEVQRALTERSLSIPVIMISAYGDVKTAVASLQAGALTFLEKPYDQGQLLEAIQQAVECDHRQTEEESKLQRLSQSWQSLSERERAVLSRMLGGQKNVVIAAALKVSERTIENDRAKILQKFEAENPTHLAVKATELRMLSDRSFRVDRPDSRFRMRNCFASAAQEAAG